MRPSTRAVSLTVFFSQLDVVLAQVLGVGALVHAGHDEGAAGARRRLFEDQGDVLTSEIHSPQAGIFVLFQLDGELQQEIDLFRGVVLHGQKMSSFQVERHGLTSNFCFSYYRKKTL